MNIEEQLEEFKRIVICDMILTSEDMRTAFYSSNTLTDSKLQFVLKLEPPKEYVNSFCICKNHNISTRLFLDTIKWQYKGFNTEKYKSLMNNFMEQSIPSSSSLSSWQKRQFTYEESLEFFDWLNDKDLFKDSNIGYENLKTFFYVLTPNLDFVKSNLSRLHYHFNRYELLTSNGSASRDFQRYFTKEDFKKLKEIYKQYLDLL